jgi:hypothetical protein
MRFTPRESSKQKAALTVRQKKGYPEEEESALELHRRSCVSRPGLSRPLNEGTLPMRGSECFTNGLRAPSAVVGSSAMSADDSR